MYQVVTPEVEEGQFDDADSSSESTLASPRSSSYLPTSLSDATDSSVDTPPESPRQNYFGGLEVEETQQPKTWRRKRETNKELLASLSLPENSPETEIQTLSSLGVSEQLEPGEEIKKWMEKVSNKMGWKFVAKVSTCKGEGCRASEIIATGNKFLTIHERFVMSVPSMLKFSPHRKFYRNLYLGVKDVFPVYEVSDVQDFNLTVLALFFVHERADSNSLHAPFLSTIPRKLSNPFHFSEKDFQELQGSALDHVIRMKMKFLKIYFNVMTVIDETQKHAFMFEDFEWAVHIILSRGAFIQHTNSFVLAPIFESMNDASEILDLTEQKLNSRNYLRYEYGADYFSAVSQKRFSRGEKLLAFHLKTNLDLFCIHGIISQYLKTGHETKIFIPTAQFEDSELCWSIKQELFSGLDINPLMVKAYSGMGLPDDLIRAMRIYALTITDFISERQKLHVLSLLLSGNMISLTNEIIALTLAIKSIDYTLDSYPTSIQEDKAKWQYFIDTDNDPEFVVLSLRILEKKVLLALKETYTEKLQWCRVERREKRMAVKS
eukprot:TRINITY_DN12805_c0_g1_i1.p1 TRINITY_DN12805_c0_g1~~TRINITY_DN12805_c0_g1_i1.p1  ORF type:complete len:556 (-),score=99.41 TRINITY_DN12805_c0_g1_i1:34-1680(-)